MFGIRFSKRPEIDEQNTGRLAFERPQGLFLVPFSGGAGIIPLGQLNACNPADVMVGPTHRLENGFVTGNISGTMDLSPLTQQEVSLGTFASV